MHSKLKGNIGEAAIIKDLAQKGFLVFKEIGDLSKIDLIAEKDGKLTKIQVKAVTSKNGCAVVDKRKSGPNYSFSYTDEMVDTFAIYVLDRDIVAYIPASELCSNNSSTNLRIDPCKTGQSKKIRYLKDYTDPLRNLRDYTPNPCDGDDIVQTTTSRAMA